MKTLAIINGPPGVGKTTVCREINRQIENSVWLDGDWCWMLNPFVVNEENKGMVEDNILHLLRNFLGNSSVETVLFSWVIPRDEIAARLLSKLQGLPFRPVRITLLSSEVSLTRRMAAQGRSQHQIEKSLASLPGYRAQNTILIDTDGLNPAEVAEQVIQALSKGLDSMK